MLGEASSTSLVTGRRGGGGGGGGESGRDTFEWDHYGTVSHTALARTVCPPPNNGGYLRLSPRAGCGGGGDGGGVGGGRLCGQGRQWPARGTVLSLLASQFRAKVRVLRWGLRSSVRNLRNMDRQKSTSLGALVLQTSVLALTIRYSRTETVNGPRYLTSTAVVMSELLKLLACLYMVFFYSARQGVHKVWQELLDVKEAAKAAVPAGIYTLQNNLQFIAVSHLDAATFQVTYQLKILTTAVFSVFFLHRRLDLVRWSALVMLTAGVAIVQLPDNDVAREGMNPTRETTAVGLFAVLVMCLSSGFAGVYFEKILKSSTQSVWAKNVQMAFVSVLLGLVGVMVGDGRRVEQHGFFQGYNLLTFVIVTQQAVLGLIVSMVMKYADNILKGFASAISIVLTSVISYVVMQDLHPTCSFLAGSVIVMGSVLLYNVDQQSHKHPLHIVV